MEGLAGEEGNVRFEAVVLKIWLDLIRADQKKLEGRLRRNEWANLRPGDLFRFVSASDPNDTLVVRVLNVHSFDTFGDAWDVFGEALIPSDSGKGGSARAVDELYSEFYTEDQVREHGAIAIEIQKVV